MTGILLIQAEYPDDGKIHAIHDVRASSKVIQLLGQRKVPGVEEHAERPACEATVSERQVVTPKRMPGGDRFAKPGNAMPVGKEVEEREQDGKRFLHAEDSAERPFSMELHHWIEHWRISGDSAVCHDMLAGIVTFGGTSPEQKTEMES